jgi:2-dehydro-3-deoxygluconokinase
VEELDVLCMGEALWDLTAPRGRTFAESSSLRLQPGGAAVNVALALARLGWRSGLVATLGADALGEALAARVAARGVSTALLERAPPRTGLVFMEQAGGAPRIVGYRSADEAPPRLEAAAWSARALVLTGLAPAEAQAASFGEAAREARRRGALVVVDLNARPRLWRGSEGGPPPSWLGDADVVKASEEDLAAIGIRDADLRAALRASAVLMVTAGAGVTRATGPFGEVRCAPVSVVAGGTALGAGDAFLAGVVDAVLRGGGVDAGFWSRALRRGHVLARRRVRSSRQKKEAPARREGGIPSQALPTK